MLDGGNLVDNLKDKAIVMDRVLTDNPKYTKEQVTTLRSCSAFL